MQYSTTQHITAHVLTNCTFSGMATCNNEMQSGLIPEIYPEFAPILAKYPCIWDPKNHEYSKERHHKKAYEMIETELKWKC